MATRAAQQQHQQPPPIRPRSRSVLSFGSHKSSGSTGKIDLTETPKEKLARKMTTKADPTKAMLEAQPGAQAYDHTTLEPLRNLQHRDVHGNLITDPDRSNPTRPRLERPLDTIRSFEAAIDGSYRKRMTRLVNPDPSFAPSRRSSYYQGASSRYSPQHRSQTDGGGYLGTRYPPRRPDSYMDDTSHTPPYAGYGRGPPPRNHVDPVSYGRNPVGGSPVYPTQGYPQSYDAATTGSGSGSQVTDQWGNSTNPSSENSSIDKINLPKQDSVEPHGNVGFGAPPQFQGPILEEARQGGPQYGQPGYGRSQRNGNSVGYQGNGAAPPTAPKHLVANEYQVSQPARAIIPLSSTHHAPPQRTESTEKRKSWLMRRFSKKG